AAAPRARTPVGLWRARRKPAPQPAPGRASPAPGDRAPPRAPPPAGGRAPRADRGSGPPVWLAVETLPLVRAAYPALVEPQGATALPPALAAETWSLDTAQRELCRRRLRHAGPVGVADLAAPLALAPQPPLPPLAPLPAHRR